jgi:hypothetical protein
MISTCVTIILRRLTPESAALLALLQTWDIYMASKSALFERFGKIIKVDLVIKNGPQEDQEIIVSVYQWILGQDDLSLGSYGVAWDAVEVRAIDRSRNKDQK